MLGKQISLIISISDPTFSLSKLYAIVACNNISFQNKFNFTESINCIICTKLIHVSDTYQLDIW